MLGYREDELLGRTVKDISHPDDVDLPNRATFGHLLAVGSDPARRNDRRLAVLFVDLDRFKIINDSLGHDAGDAMLRAAAQRLRSCVRASDVVARLGGDEFVVLLQEITEAADAAQVARNILAALRQPVAIMGQEWTVSASIGICLHPDGDQQDHEVLKNADIAMYLAKQSGKDGCRVYVNELADLGRVRQELAQSGLAASSFELEMMEEVVLRSPERAARTLVALKRLGVAIAIAAYGTGRASFADLKRFPIDTLKIDRTRFNGVAADPDKQAYLQGVIALGRVLGMRVAADGVASAHDAAYLRANGCVAAHSSWCDRPLVASECGTLLCERGRG
jgi:diguanylate cyclase (GGDEF)-like protein